MKTQFQQVRPISPSPAKCQTPDNLRKHRNKSTISPSATGQLRKRQQKNISPSTPIKIPFLPYEKGNNKTEIKGIRNNDSSISPRHRHITVTINKKQNKQNYHEDEVREKIEQIYVLVKDQDEGIKEKSLLLLLEETKKGVTELIRVKEELSQKSGNKGIGSKENTFASQKQQLQLENNPQEQENVISIFQANDIQNENIKLKKEVAYLQIELEKKGKIIQSAIFNSQKYDLPEGSPEKEVKITASTISKNLFLKQQNQYLQSELDNKNSRILMLIKENEEEQKRLKEKLDNANNIIQNEMGMYKKVIDQQKNAMNSMQEEITILKKKCDNIPKKKFERNSLIIDLPPEKVSPRKVQSFIESQDKTKSVVEKLKSHYESLLKLKNTEHTKRLNIFIDELRIMKEKLLEGEELHNTDCIYSQFFKEQLCEGCITLKQEIWMKEIEKMELEETINLMKREFEESSILMDKKQQSSSFFEIVKVSQSDLSENSDKSKKNKNKRGKFQKVKKNKPKQKQEVFQSSQFSQITNNNNNNQKVNLNQEMTKCKILLKINEYENQIMESCKRQK